MSEEQKKEFEIEDDKDRWAARLRDKLKNGDAQHDGAECDKQIPFTAEKASSTL